MKITIETKQAIEDRELIESYRFSIDDITGGWIVEDRYDGDEAEGRSVFGDSYEDQERITDTTTYISVTQFINDGWDVDAVTESKRRAILAYPVYRTETMTDEEFAEYDKL